MNRLKPPIEKRCVSVRVGFFLSLCVCWFYDIPLENEGKVQVEQTKSENPLYKVSFEIACWFCF